MSGNNKKNIEDARRFLWEDDEAASRSSSRIPASSGQRGFSTRDFAVDQSNNLMDMGREDDIMADNRRSAGSGGTGRMSDTIAGLFRPSGTQPVGRIDEYMDAAPSADSDEYISDKRRRLNPLWTAMVYYTNQIVMALGRLGLRGSKLSVCLLVGFGMIGGGLYMILSSGNDESTAAASGSGSIDTGSTRYNNIRNRIIEANVTPEDLFDPKGKSPQHSALAWIVQEDPANLNFDHPALLDRYSLAVFFFASPNARSGGWKNSDAWLTEKGICAWHGIECLPREQEATAENDFKPFTNTYNDNDRVTGISLKDNEIEGEIPPEWGIALDQLITLDLQDNRLSHVLPKTLGNLVNLRNILLRNNRFSGSLPAEFGALTNIHQLNLAKNDFDGPIPTSWSNLKELRNFAVSNNLLTGGFPDFSKMSKLIGLYLDDNGFEGPIPAHFDHFPELMDLWLSKNKFTGVVTSLADLPNIETIHIDENEFEGTLPDMFDYIFQIREFHAQHSKFSGPIPNTITHMQSMKTLNLSNNNFDGTIPPGLGMLTDIISIMIDDNELTGPIPTLLGKLDDISRLSLSNNKLTGTIPSELSRCFRLAELFVNSNKLEDYYPTLSSDIFNAAITLGLRGKSMARRRLTPTLEDKEETDEHDLVEEVLREFPPEERGEREEWNQQVGWHRKENIRKSAGHPDLRGSAKKNIDTLQVNGTVHSSPPLQRWVLVSIGLLIAAAFAAKFLRKKSKGRMQ
ncbi:two component regulator [Nitzschia inconspicua]|uniref:Two component regulator n=1 Tax=Nitzschia inconspicua TaxID=303405 RepID=A0A9K3PH71_9STRA|nr:two component regulator [Nitzschia inconspicua]KAG7347562.1 two component regulator [Nitzschia inconspicua]